jgi:hypothetical protein
MSPRVQKTEAFRVFEANLERSRAFLRIFDKDRGVGQPSNDEKELLRGSQVTRALLATTPHNRLSAIAAPTTRLL